MNTKPLSLDVILSNKFPDDYEAWVLQDQQSNQYVIIPHPKYPGRHPIHFFMKREDAQDILDELLRVNDKLGDRDIIPIQVNLKQSIYGIATDRDPDHADGFVVHSPNEVFEYFWNH